MRIASTSRLAAVTFAVSAALLSACGGGGGGGGSSFGGPPPSTPTPRHSDKPSPSPKPSATPSATPSPSPSATPTATPTPGRVTLDPPEITFTQSGPGDYVVTVSGGSGSYYVGTDTCTPQGIAEWQQLSNPNQYDVSYGVNIGSCSIQFVDGADKNNSATLQVTNNHNPH